MGEAHPWAEFLDARARVIEWLYRDEGPCKANDEAIAKTLSMDRVQVYLIRTRNEPPRNDAEARQVGATIRRQIARIKDIFAHDEET